MVASSEVEEDLTRDVGSLSTIEGEEGSAPSEVADVETSTVDVGLSSPPSEVAGSEGVVLPYKILARRINSDLVVGLTHGPIGLFLLDNNSNKCSVVARKWSSIVAKGIGILSGINLTVSVNLVAWVSGIKTLIHR